MLFFYGNFKQNCLPARQVVGTAQSTFGHNRGLSSITSVSWQGKAWVEKMVTLNRGRSFQWSKFIFSKLQPERQLQASRAAAFSQHCRHQGLGAGALQGNVSECSKVAARACSRIPSINWCQTIWSTFLSKALGQAFLGQKQTQLHYLLFVQGISLADVLVVQGLYLQ